MSTGKLTLGKLAEACGLARASLLHYETLGLLAPVGRSAGGYRLYGDAELERLRAIRRFREAGLSLAAIRDLLAPLDPVEASRRSGAAGLLETRLLDLSKEVERLRAQQKLLARLLATPEFRAGLPCEGKAAWVAMLRRAGFSEDDMRQWHRDFEADRPAEHDAFLRSLQLPPAEIAAIRCAAKPQTSK
jgi:DNA-binding transcriptional MerR regulator